ncbi:hypothetical protein [Nonomuraea sp. NPDC005692]|uniref:hypothetical protein n=1 Tax=Nonomuraea sp. NPDC005692 TaxID=3157168 RepID=UPI0034022C91
MFTHGTVEILNPEDGEPAADWPYLFAYCKNFYGDDAFDRDDDVVYGRPHPHWMTAYARTGHVPRDLIKRPRSGGINLFDMGGSPSARVLLCCERVDQG